MKNIRKYILFSFFYLIGFIINLFVNRYVFQNLENEEYGKYSYFFNILLLAHPILSLNFKDGVLRFYYKHSHSYWHAVIFLCLISLLIGFIFSLFFTLLYFPLFFIIWFNVIGSILRGRERLFEFNLQRVIPALFLLCTVYLVKPTSHETVIFLTGIGYLFSIISFSLLHLNDISTVLKSRIRINKVLRETKELITYSTPTLLTTLSLWGFSFIDQYIIKYFYDFKYLSDFAAAVKILNVFKVALSIVLIIYPVYYFKNYDNSDRIIKLRKLIIVGTILSSAFFILLSDTLYILFSAYNYRETSYLLILLLISESFKFISTLYLTVFAQIKRPIITTYVYLSVTLVSTIVNITIVPIFGNFGCALVSVVTSILLLASAIILNKKYEFK